MVIILVSRGEWMKHDETGRCPLGRCFGASLSKYWWQNTSITDLDEKKLWKTRMIWVQLHWKTA